jgi:hypothetical protein
MTTLLHNAANYGTVNGRLNGLPPGYYLISEIFKLSEAHSHHNECFFSGREGRPKCQRRFLFMSTE